MMGGLSSIGLQLPPKAAGGSNLKHALKCAFLVLTAPMGFDAVPGTRWKNMRRLPKTITS
jgi:5-methyltetrahydrofolate--homocysteine methyltransferase